MEERRGEGKGKDCKRNIVLGKTDCLPGFFRHSISSLREPPFFLSFRLRVHGSGTSRRDRLCGEREREREEEMTRTSKRAASLRWLSRRKEEDKEEEVEKLEVGAKELLHRYFFRRPSDGLRFSIFSSRALPFSLLPEPPLVPFTRPKQCTTQRSVTEHHSSPSVDTFSSFQRRRRKGIERESNAAAAFVVVAGRSIGSPL